MMANAFPARESTGILLPLLIIGDLCAVSSFQKYTLWNQITRVLPPTFLGIIIGFFIMRGAPEVAFKGLLGWMLLVTVLVQTLRHAFPQLGGRIPNSVGFTWAIGIWAGVTTMIANAAGPIMAVYFLALSIPKENLVGTSAWLFLIINVAKLPFSAALGLLQTPSLLLDIALTPLVFLGNFAGKRLLQHIPQRAFEVILLVSASAAAIKMIVF